MPIDYRGATTLVTGASSGIGDRFARELARRGSHLVLVARREERLETLAAELRGAHDVSVTVLAADLAEPGAAARLSVRLRERGIRLTGLVNNAGFGTHISFADADPDIIRAQIALDVHAVVDLTRTFIDELAACGNGFLINVASMAAYMPVPRMAVYGAAKAFVLSFTEALWYEHRGSGLRVLAVSPGATRTEFFDVAGPQASGGARLQKPERVVATAMRALDRRDPPPSVAVGRRNRWAVATTGLMGRRAAVSLMGAMTDRASATPG